MAGLAFLFVDCGSGSCVCSWWEKDKPPPTPDDFHDRAVKDIQEWKQCQQAQGTAACVRRFNPQQLIKGMYGEFLQVRRW